MLLKVVKLLVPLILALNAIYATAPDEHDNLDRSYIYPTTQKLQKIALNQNGYVQFIAYKMEIPQITKYTFCTWVKSYNLTYVHPLLSTSQNGEDHNIFVYISSYGRYLVARILNQELLKVSIQIHENKWSNICQSWDSRTGWWQVYLNGNLIEQGINEALRHVQVPRSKDLLVGQDFSNLEIGLPGGLHGEVFGFNMVLASTTETPTSNVYQTVEIDDPADPTQFQESQQPFLLDYIDELGERQEEPGLPNPYIRKFKNDNGEVIYENYEDDNEVLNTNRHVEEYPSEHLTPPNNFGDSDLKITSTDSGFNVEILHPPPSPSAPGIAQYQTPPPLPKYLSKNSKASYELNYVRDNFFGETPENSKFAVDVLNFLKSDRYEKLLAKRNGRTTKNKRRKSKTSKRVYSFRPKASSRSGVANESYRPKATRRSEFVVSPSQKTIKQIKNTPKFNVGSNAHKDQLIAQPTQSNIVVGSPSKEKIEIKSNGEVGLTHKMLKREAVKKSHNIEIVNPETLINKTREGKEAGGENHERSFLIDNDYEDVFLEDLPSLEMISEAISERRDPRQFKPSPFQSFSKGIITESSSASPLTQQKEHRKSFGDKTREETYESLYSRLHYVGPRYKNNDRKIVRSKGTKGTSKFTTKTVLRFDDLKPLKYFSLPTSFGTLQTGQSKDYIVFEEPKKSLKDIANSLNIAVLSTNRSYSFPQLQDDVEVPLSKYDFGVHHPRVTRYSPEVDKLKLDNTAHSTEAIKSAILTSQLPKQLSSGRLLVELSYRKCLISHGSPLAFDQTSLITWNYTPVILYGGATVQLANPECGIF